MAVLFLLDTNVAIAGDPLSTDLEPGAPEVIELLRLLSAHRHDVRTHPASMTDFARDTNNRRREARLATFRKYEALTEPPVPTPRQRELLGEPRPGSNDAVDHELLAAVVGDAVSYLVTDDRISIGRTDYWQTNLEYERLPLEDQLAELIVRYGA